MRKNLNIYWNLKVARPSPHGVFKSSAKVIRRRRREIFAGGVPRARLELANRERERAGDLSVGASEEASQVVPRRRCTGCGSMCICILPRAQSRR